MKELKAPAGSRTKKVIVGRGSSSGRGKTSGRGHKGALARSGNTKKMGFEGGQMNLLRRLPKYGFSNAVYKKFIAEIDFDKLNQAYKGDSEITFNSLREKKLMGKNDQYAKILANGKPDFKYTVAKEIKLTAKAKEILEKAGGAIK